MADTIRKAARPDAEPRRPRMATGHRCMTDAATIAEQELAGAWLRERAHCARRDTQRGKDAR